jgi:hypothetical protein
MDRTKDNCNAKEHFTYENRIMGEFYGSQNSPTVIILAGIHGNEKAGVHAARRVIDRIRSGNLKFGGNLYLLLGNINALNKNVRFEDVDLNRIWRKEMVEGSEKNANEPYAEQREFRDIFNLLKGILLREEGPFYFLDLHTTSSSSVPFITISDSLNNRKFASHFHMPVILGIEEYLDGPLLTFINEFGHVALGFEGGAHKEISSVDNCEAFIWKALVHSKCLDRQQMSADVFHDFALSNLSFKPQFFEIKYRYQIGKSEEFNMKPGFENFQSIEKSDPLARSNGKDILSPRSGLIFMPLYQELGEDGFFILKRISKFWLSASIIARKLKINHFLRLIPGVRQDPGNNYTLIVDPGVARFMTRQVFHLFGYRQRIVKDAKFHFIKRDRKVLAFQ